MKTITPLFCLIAALMLPANIAHAQWSAGPRGGVNLPNEDMYLPAGGMATPKPIIGAAVRYRLTPWAALEVQPQYIVKGKNMWQPFFAADAEGWVTPDLAYIEMPILIAIGTSFESFGVEGFAGVAPARLLSATVRYQHWDGATGGLADVRKSIGLVNVMSQPRDEQDIYPWSRDHYYRSRDVKFIGGVMFGF